MVGLLALLDWQALLANLTIVTFVMLVWAQGLDFLPSQSARLKPALFGLVMAAGSIASMAASARMAPGVIFDLRTAYIAIAGFFGGPVAAAITLVAAVTCRLAIGGAGAFAGSVAMVLVCLAGLVGHRLLNGRLPTRTDVAKLAVSATAAGLFAVVLMSGWMRPEFLVWRGVAAALEFVGILMAGCVLLQIHRRQQAEEENVLYRAVIEALPDCLNVKDPAGRFLAVNPATAKLMRAGSPSEMIGKTDFDYYPTDIAARLLADERDTLLAGTPRIIEQQVAFEDESGAWLSTLKAPLIDHDGRMLGLITHNRDITENKQLADELTVTRRRLDDALGNMIDGLAMFDATGTILICNRRYAALFPKTADLRHAGSHFADIMRQAIIRGEEVVPPHNVERWVAERCAGLRIAGERTFRLNDGRWLMARTQLAADGGSVVVVSDITVRRRTEEDLAEAVHLLQEMATTDALTGLANRRTFDQTLEREIIEHRRDGRQMSLLLADVDRFKAFNG